MVMPAVVAVIPQSVYYPWCVQYAMMNRILHHLGTHGRSQDSYIKTGGGDTIHHIGGLKTVNTVCVCIDLNPAVRVIVVRVVMHHKFG
jgi:hypothetical protein